jgi:hypothetical protein
MRIGSALSVKGDLKVGSTFYIGDSNYNKIVAGSGGTAYTFYADDGASASTKRIEIAEAAGTSVLHGAWQSDTVVTTSDRRLKKNITPLYQAILKAHGYRSGSAERHQLEVLNRNATEHMNVRGQSVDDDSSSVVMTSDESTFVTNLFRRLRPVSYNLKTDVEAKRMNFGFIAQELEELYPNLVTNNERSGFKAVAYTDIIALITLTVQQEMARLDIVSTKLTELEGIASEHDLILESSEKKIIELENELQLMKLRRADDISVDHQQEEDTAREEVEEGSERVMHPADETGEQERERSRQERVDTSSGNESRTDERVVYV